MKPTIAALSLGGNVGDTRAAFVKALSVLAAAPGVAVVARSSVWRTPPWGKTDQPDFLNMAALVETSLSARALLDLCLSVERELGRARAERWGPRVIDIDIVDYGGMTINERNLVLPHPRATGRAFVLAPLAEIAPTLQIARDCVANHLARVGQGDAQRLGPLADVG